MSLLLILFSLVFREADNAIIGLNGKPPLHWHVTYSLDNSRRDAECFHHFADAGPGSSNVADLQMFCQQAHGVLQSAPSSFTYITSL